MIDRAERGTPSLPSRESTHLSNFALLDTRPRHLQDLNLRSPDYRAKLFCCATRDWKAHFHNVCAERLPHHSESDAQMVLQPSVTEAKGSKIGRALKLRGMALLTSNQSDISQTGESVRSYMRKRADSAFHCVCCTTLRCNMAARAAFRKRYGWLVSGGSKC